MAFLHWPAFFMLLPWLLLSLGGAKGWPLDPMIVRDSWGRFLVNRGLISPSASTLRQPLKPRIVWDYVGATTLIDPSAEGDDPRNASAVWSYQV